MLAWFSTALGLTAFGCLMVASAAHDPTATLGLGPEAKAQVIWMLVALGTGVVAARMPFGWWRTLSVPSYVAALVVILGMMVLAGTSLVPLRKGQANWLVVGSLQIQPVEFIKVAVLLGVARLITAPGFEARWLSHCLLALLVSAVPAGLLAREDLGSALTFPAVVLGMLVVAGMRGKHLGLLLLTGLLLVSGGIAALPKEGPKAYQYRRIQAWLHPDDYALTEGYQTARSVSAIGSGRVVGKGWREGEQNRLGLIPEKHTDLISAVIGEEWGFLGILAILIAYGALIWIGLGMASSAKDPGRRLVIVGVVCLVGGQAGINLGVALGLMPVTGVTLPLISYGGSSLVGTWLALGIAGSASRTLD